MRAKIEVKGDLMMASRQNGERTRVMIVEQDLGFGMKLADWLATHGYQPVFIRTVEAAIDELSSFRPQAILLIQTVCPNVSVLTIADQTSEDLTQVVFRQGVRRFLVRPVEFSQIGEVLQSELSAATVIG